MKPGYNPKNEKIKTDANGFDVDRIFIARYKISAENAGVEDNDAVLATVTDTGAEQEITTNIINPAIPRNITATAGGTATDIAAIQVVIKGTNFADEEISETLPAFTVDTAGTVTGNKAFKTVTSITIPAHSGVSATTSIGVGSKLGLPYKLAHNTIDAVYFDNAKESTAPTVTVSSEAIESNTVVLATALSGKVVDIYLKV
jgi:hypothetical protein